MALLAAAGGVAGLAAADGMRRLAMRYTAGLAQADRSWRALVATPLRDIGEVDDVSVLHCFQLWTKSDDKTLAALCRGLLFRRLYKTFDLTWTPDVKRIPDAVHAAETGHVLVLRTLCSVRKGDSLAVILETME